MRKETFIIFIGIFCLISSFLFAKKAEAQCSLWGEGCGAVAGLNCCPPYSGITLECIYMMPKIGTCCWPLQAGQRGDSCKCEEDCRAVLTCTGGTCCDNRVAWQRDPGETCYCNVECKSGQCIGGVCGGAAGEVCGDCKKEGVEECDDCNTVSGDGCSSSCTIEVAAGSTCTDAGCACVDSLHTCGVLGGELDPGLDCIDPADLCCCPSVGPPPPPEVCGNGVKEGTEECDDGNTVNYDGCSSTCKNEGSCYPAGCACVQNPKFCKVFDPDAIIDYSLTCLDPDLTVCCCPPPAPPPGCGNGVREGTEECDAGANNGLKCIPAYNSSCDYCSFSCDIVTLQGGYCGDGTINGPEECDDGNTVSGDGCSSSCEKECSPRGGDCGTSADCCPGFICNEIKSGPIPTPSGKVCCDPSLNYEIGHPCLCAQECQNNISCIHLYCGGPPSPSPLLYCGDGKVSPEIGEECEKDGDCTVQGMVCSNCSCVLPSTIGVTAPITTQIGPSNSNIINLRPPLDCTTIEDCIGRIINFLFSLAVIIAPLMIVIAGFLFVTAAGNPEKIAQAKKVITWTLIGFLIASLANAIVYIIKNITG